MHHMHSGQCRKTLIFQLYTKSNLDLHDLSTHADVSIDEYNSALLLGVRHDEGPTVLTEVDAIVDLGWHGISHLHKKTQAINKVNVTEDTFGFHVL